MFAKVVSMVVSQVSRVEVHALLVVCLHKKSVGDAEVDEEGARDGGRMLSSKKKAETVD